MNGEYRGWITSLDTFDETPSGPPASRGCLVEVRWERQDLLRSYFYTTSPCLQSTLEMAYAGHLAIRLSAHSQEQSAHLGAPPPDELVKLTGHLPAGLISGPFLLRSVWTSTAEQIAEPH